MRLLHIDSSILGDSSVTRQLTAAIVEKCKKEVPDLIVTYRDLAVDLVPHISNEYFMARAGYIGERSAALEQELKHGELLLDEFVGADACVIGVPMYNWTVPSTLKAWIDRICVVGRTFRYTETGYEGLVGDKPIIIASSRGGLYSPGNPGAMFDHQETYLVQILGLVGITNIQFIRAEGVGLGEDFKIKAIGEAMCLARARNHLGLVPAD